MDKRDGAGPSKVNNDVLQTEENVQDFGVIVEKLDSVMGDGAFWAQIHMICIVAAK